MVLPVTLDCKSLVELRSGRDEQCDARATPSRSPPTRGRIDPPIIRCASKAEAQQVLGVVAQRMEQVGLESHPGKTPEFRVELTAASPRLSCP
jgi:hypothetical protein